MSEVKKRIAEKPAKKNGTVARLKKLFPAGVNITRKKIWLSFDGTRAAYRIVSNSARGHVGEWHRGKPVVFVDSHLRGLDWKSIALHEAVEKLVAQKHSLDVDSQAHAVAVAVEKKWLEKQGGNWRSHQMKVYHDWRKHGRK